MWVVGKCFLPFFLQIRAGVVAHPVDDAFVAQDFQVGRRHCRRHRVAGVGHAVVEIARIHQHLGHPVADHHPANRLITRRQALGNRHQIRRKAKILAAKPAPGAAKATNHFVADQQNIVLAADALDFWPIGGRRDNHPTGALNRLANKGGELSPEEYGLKAARALEAKILELGAENVAAFIGEPIQGAGGIIIPPSTYWPEIQRICDQYGILLVADEVICGFGRTGEWFGSQYFGIRPHLMTIAKGLSSGYLPIGGVLVHDQVAKVLIEAGDFNHGFTYSGHPVAAAVAAENLRILKNERIIERMRDEMAPYVHQLWQDAFADHPLVDDVRCVGYFFALTLVDDKASRKRFDNGDALALRGRDICFANNLIMRAVHDSLIAAPPLVMSRADAENFVALARRCVDQLARELGRLP